MNWEPFLVNKAFLKFKVFKKKSLLKVCNMADRISVWLIIKAHCAQDLVFAGYLWGSYIQKGLFSINYLFWAIADPVLDLSKPDPSNEKFG